MSETKIDPYPTCTKYFVTFASSNTRCCAWCGVDLSVARFVKYINGNMPCCDLCFSMGKRR